MPWGDLVWLEFSGGRNGGSVVSDSHLCGDSIYHRYSHRTFRTSRPWQFLSRCSVIRLFNGTVAGVGAPASPPAFDQEEVHSPGLMVLCGHTSVDDKQ
jgi:hypothetical protein